MTPAQRTLIRFTLWTFGSLIGGFILVHLVAIALVALNVLWAGQVVAWFDLILLVLFILCLPLFGFLLFWSFIVGIIGVGVRLGMGGRR